MFGVLFNQLHIHHFVCMMVASPLARHVPSYLVSLLFSLFWAPVYHPHPSSCSGQITKIFRTVFRVLFNQLGAQNFVCMTVTSHMWHVTCYLCSSHCSEPQCTTHAQLIYYFFPFWRHTHLRKNTRLSPALLYCQRQKARRRPRNKVNILHIWHGWLPVVWVSYSRN